MQAIIVGNRDAGIAGMTLTHDLPYPHAAENAVIVKVHAAGFTPGELDWPGTWTDRAGRDRTPSVPGHELSGVIVELGYGTTGLTVGQRRTQLTELATRLRDGRIKPAVGAVRWMTNELAAVSGRRARKTPVQTVGSSHNH